MTETAQPPTLLLIPPSAEEAGDRIAGCLDAGGGAAASAPASTRLTITLPSLQALDLRDSPHLHTLDLRGAAPGVHVSVVGCPALRLLQLPSRGGAHVHIDSGSRPPELRIEGALAQLDACWADRSFLAQAAPDEAWMGACVTGVADVEAARNGTDGHLLVLVDDAATAAKLDLAAAGTPKAVVVVGPGGVRELAGPTAALSRLEVTAADRLTSIVLPGTVGQLVVSRSPALSQLQAAQGCGTVRLHDGTGARAGLQIDLQCDTLVIADSRIRRLVLTHPASVQLLRCQALNDVTLPDGCRVECEGHVPPPLLGVSVLFASEALLGQLVRRHAAGDADAWPQLQALVPHACAPRFAPAALKALQAVRMAGANAAEVWHARRQLNLRNTQGKAGHASRQAQPAPPSADPALADRTWRWRFGDDLALDGWRADLALWQACCHLPGLDGYARRMAQALATGQAAIRGQDLSQTLVQPLLRPAQRDQPGVRLLLAATMRQSGSQPGLWDSVLASWAEKLLAEELPSDGLDDLRDAALSRFAEDGPGDALLRVMAMRMQRHPVDTRVRLARLAPNAVARMARNLDAIDLRAAVRTLMLSGRLPEQFNARPAPRRRPAGLAIR